VLILWFLYSQIQVRNAFGRAVLVAVLIVICFGLEFIGGAFLILGTAGIGFFGYLLLIPVISGWISVWYRKHLAVQPALQIAPAGGPGVGAAQPFVYPEASKGPTAEHEAPATDGVESNEHGNEPSKPSAPEQQPPEEEF
jgi:hypothetical protein